MRSERDRSWRLGGLSNTEIARRERASVPTVGKWRSPYALEKIEALADAPRSIGDKKVEEILTKALKATPRARTHWISHIMAKEGGISERSVLRIWRAFGTQAPQGGFLQAEQGSDVCREGARYCEALSQFAR